MQQVFQFTNETGSHMLTCSLPGYENVVHIDGQPIEFELSKLRWVAYAVGYVHRPVDFMYGAAALYHDLKRWGVLGKVSSVEFCERR